MLDNYHLELARAKREKFLIKDKRINELKEGEIVVLKNQTDVLNSHKKVNLGPYKILEKRGVSAYYIEHLLLGTRLIRNRRYLIKIDMTPKDREILSSKKNLLFNTNHDIIDNSDKPTPITNSPLDVQNLKASIRGRNSENEEDNSYNLRSRKNINYKM